MDFLKKSQRDKVTVDIFYMLKSALVDMNDRRGKWKIVS